VGESSFWYRPTRVVPDQRPLNGRLLLLAKFDFTSNEHRSALTLLAGRQEEHTAGKN